jgi:hypothetical protein
MNIVQKNSKTMFKNEKTNKTWADIVKGHEVDVKKVMNLLKYIKNKHKIFSLTVNDLERVILDYLNIPKWDKKYIYQNLSLKNFLMKTQLTDYLIDWKHLGLEELLKIEKISLLYFPYTICNSVYSKILDFDSKEYTYSLELDLDLNKELIEKINNSNLHYNIKLTNHKKYIAFQFDLFNKVKEVFDKENVIKKCRITLEFMLDKKMKLPTELTLYLEKECQSKGIIQILDRKTFKVENPKEYNDECPICLEGFEKNEKKIITKCGHVFHTSCIKEGADNLFTRTYICKHENCNHNQDEDGHKIIYDYIRCPICRSV